MSAKWNEVAVKAFLMSWNEFCGRTTFHGFYIFARYTNSNVFNFIWTLILGIMACCSILLCKTFLNDFLNNGVLNYYINQQLLGNSVFPGVTVCPAQKILYSEAEKFLNNL